jgi:hypothetical protein
MKLTVMTTLILLHTVAGRGVASFLKRTRRSYAAAHVLHMAAPRPDDYIDAEYVEKPGSSTGTGGLDRKQRPDQTASKESSSGGGLFASAANALARVFGQDKESLARKERQKEVNKAVDQMLGPLGGGLLGGVMKGVFSQVGGMLAEAAREAGQVRRFGHEKHALAPYHSQSLVLWCCGRTCRRCRCW